MELHSLRKTLLVVVNYNFPKKPKKPEKHLKSLAFCRMGRALHPYSTAHRRA